MKNNAPECERCQELVNIEPADNGTQYDKVYCLKCGLSRPFERRLARKFCPNNKKEKSDEIIRR